MAKQRLLMEPAAVPEELDLTKKYRPQLWADVVGHEFIPSIRDTLRSGGKRSFLFTGPSGVGKTTISRVMANALKKMSGTEVAYREIDAATYTGIDAMREITEWMLYRPFARGGKKLVCIDEAHALSKAAWQSLLKSVEEPPPHGYWVFCSTEAGKIPETIQTRCACYHLGLVATEVLFDLVSRVAGEEGMPLGEDVLGVVARAAQGSPRRALVYLTKCRKAKSCEEAAVLLQSPGEAPELIELCRLMMKGGLTWPKAMKILADKTDMNPEAIRIPIVAYFNSVLRGAKTDDAAGRAMQIQNAFLPGPYYASNGLAELYRDLANVIFG